MNLSRNQGMTHPLTLSLSSPDLVEFRSPQTCALITSFLLIHYAESISAQVDVTAKVLSITVGDTSIPSPLI